MLTKPPVPYDFCVGVPISRLLTVGSTLIKHSVLNVKALVGTFNQEKALVGAFSVIVKIGCGTDGALLSTTEYPGDPQYASVPIKTVKILQ